MAREAAAAVWVEVVWEAAAVWAASAAHVVAFNPSHIASATDSYILAVGSENLVVVHAGSGVVEDTLSLEDPPIAPVLIGDVNSDGTNDVLVLTKKGYRGLLGIQRQGHAVLPYLLLSVLMLVGMLVASQKFSAFQDPWSWHYATGGKRSTD